MKKTIYPVIAVLLSILIWTACSTSFDPAPSLSPQGPSDEESAAAVNGEQPIDIAAERPEEEAAPSEEIILDESSPGEEPVDVLDAALEAYQEALAAWDRGDIETALNALDAAYGLLLKVNLPADSPLVNQKDELRLLIAQRLQGLYATRTGVVGANNGTIPLEENKYVQEEIRSFQTRERKDFEEAYRRSGLYRAMILEELRKQGLPEELSWVPIIESGFKVTAYSKARALGLWQFISSTGYRFGLKRDRWVDERMDPLKSTQAALRYLNELHEMFGD